MSPIFTIFKKEMKDMLRDRRTIMAMIVFPLLLIPLVFTLINKVSFSSDKGDTIKDLRIAIASNENGAELIQRFERRRDLKILKDISPYEFEALILEDSIDFGLVIDKNFDAQIEKGKTGKVQLFHNSPGRDTSKYNRIAKTIRAYQKAVVDERLQTLGTDRSVLKATDIKTTNINPRKRSIGAFAGSILPLFFIVFCFVGAMYPAIDLFTGEKERGTIETLLVLPANRFHILIGKLLVIILAGVTSGLLTFLGLFAFIKLNPDLPFISVILNTKSILWIILMMFPLTTFFAGMFVPLSVYAKSFKEAQSLIQPLLVLIVVPVFAAIFPSMELNLKTAMIPILNVALASKAIVADSFEFSHLVIVYISLLILAGLGIILAKRWFENEKNFFRT